jgi:putative ABC transport system permease protein
MWKNYLKIAWRNLAKNRLYSALNISGIALSLAAFMLILTYVGYEKNANQEHQNLDNVYRIVMSPKEGKPYPFAQAPMASAAKSDFPEVKDFCRMISAGSTSGIISFVDGSGVRQSFREADAIYADAGLFRLFSIPARYGKVELETPYTIVLTRSRAEKFFGDAQTAVGKTLTLNNQFGKADYRVSAVCDDQSDNADLKFSMVYSLQTLATPAGRGNNDWADINKWGFTFLNIFLLLDENANVPMIETKLTEMLHKNDPATTDNVRLQRGSEVHLGASLSDPLPTEGSLAFLYIMLGIGVLILVIAWLNYINLSTATMLKRAKEVSIRKTVGANRRELIQQFLLESVLLNAIGIGLAFFLVELSIGLVQDLTQKKLALAYLFHNYVWLLGVGLVLIGIFGAAFYVAMVLSSSSPAAALKGVFSRSAKGARLRKSLVVFQFAVSVTLIIMTIVMNRQLQFMQTNSSGMTLENRLVIKGPEDIASKKPQEEVRAFLNECAAQGFVKNYALGKVPGTWYNFAAKGFTPLTPTPADKEKSFSVMMMNERFLDVYGIGVVSGRNFTPDEVEKSFSGNKLMVNERAAKELGFPAASDAVGKKILWGADKEWEIVGVVKNYNHQSLKEPISSVVFIPQNNIQYFSLVVEGGDMTSRIAVLERLYKQRFPTNPFEYFFADENYDRQYSEEKQYGKIFLGAASLAILISCLGLFGLATFSVEQRTKEIGVRKVLGATIQDVTLLLSKDFLKLVVIAFLIAAPVGYVLMQKWLADFPYRVDLKLVFFLAAGGLALAIALLTVSVQSIRAAMQNPVKSLRYE